MNLPSAAREEDIRKLKAEPSKAMLMVTYLGPC